MERWRGVSMFNTFCGNQSDLVISPGTHIHMLGIGGVGMCGLALLAKSAGYSISGSDGKEGELLPILRQAGIPVFAGEGGILPEETGLLVYTLAISEEHCEIRAAEEKKIHTISRADLLGILMRRFSLRIGVAGSHGKSTVTAMIGKVLADAGLCPTVLCGARMEGGSVFLPGKEDVLVYEACEYKDSFLATFPTHPVLLNLEYDHPDWFADLSSLKKSFARFMRKPSVQKIVYHEEDEALSELVSGEICPSLRYGLNGKELFATGIEEKGGFYSFTLRWGGESLGRVSLQVPGKYQIENALAAAGAAISVGASPLGISASLSGFAGLHRRMEYLGRRGGCSFFEDYAHHPTELVAALRTAEAMTEGRVLFVFQPHTYSRTEALFNDFVHALKGGQGVILETFAAREKNTEGRGARELAQDAGLSYATTESAAAEWIRKTAQPGDLVLLLGAGELGPVWRMLQD